MSAHRNIWSADISCEGGPVIVANLEDFMQWRGAEPIDPRLATELRHWGQFTAELPEVWRPNGPAGHQYIADAEPRRRAQALIDLVLARWPGSDVDQRGMPWRVTRPDGKFMNLALEPGSEYARAIRGLGLESVHAFGNGASGYLWSVAPGSVRIHVDASRGRLVLAEVEFAEDEEETERAYAHALDAAAAPAEGSLRYRVTHGPVAVAWSPNSARDLARPIGADDVSRDSAGQLLDLAIQASGALLWLQPGWYAPSLNYHENARWGISWCDFRRM